MPPKKTKKAKKKKAPTKKNPNRLPKGVKVTYAIDVNNGNYSYDARDLELFVNSSGNLEIVASCGDSETFNKTELAGIEFAIKKLKPEMAS